MRIVCLGEALVDLVCEHAVDSADEVEAFVPHFGGAMANVAVQAARHGGDVAIAGGVGDDQWGHWLKRRFEAERVDTSALVLESGGRTPLALVTVDASGEPSYAIYGSTTGLGLVPAAAQLDGAIDRAGVVVLSSNTLLGAEERALTLGARDRALAAGKLVAVDANLRPPRWSDQREMRDATLDLLQGAFLAKMNRREAELLTGEAEPARAAEALLAGGVAQNVVVTSSEHGATLRGSGGLARDVPAVPVLVTNAAGAGDAVTGVLVARLAAAGGYAPALHVALETAMRAAADVVQRWSAV